MCKVEPRGSLKVTSWLLLDFPLGAFGTFAKCRRPFHERGQRWLADCRQDVRRDQHRERRARCLGRTKKCVACSAHAGIYRHWKAVSNISVTYMSQLDQDSVQRIPSDPSAGGVGMTGAAANLTGAAGNLTGAAA
jgi:hypothetical protein